MFEVILFEPEIPPNTGNIIRLCANTGARLHLIQPLGFRLEDRRLRRAGLDYHEWARVREYPDLAECLAALGSPRLLAFTTRSDRAYHKMVYRPGDALLFGPETRGLPTEILESLPEEQRLRIPMLTAGRSLNLSNTVAIALYEAWRQYDFPGAW
ncbi:MAG: tRNA (cytidine(34)-2'-O)-methyltransferase [Candidatus Competibacteraceae bacterium]|nr:tRNA (cytidine(34)-2'-O)-methyltransferase [Candidatus Competibacteraceae bacterium]MCP5125985.1 tRNA (cytidine(34)-2'-O)-methyltransferase [Gammaproteobacteria bacterium]HRX70725.1 tRNA (cytidine(34)-2'-O)-methyltransferase [Candidatus Competibacteraceae bacterium]